MLPARSRWKFCGSSRRPSLACGSGNCLRERAMVAASSQQVAPCLRPSAPARKAQSRRARCCPCLMRRGGQGAAAAAAAAAIGAGAAEDRVFEIFHHRHLPSLYLAPRKTPVGRLDAMPRRRQARREARGELPALAPGALAAARLARSTGSSPPSPRLMPRHWPLARRDRSRWRRARGESTSSASSGSRRAAKSGWRAAPSSALLPPQPLAPLAPLALGAGAGAGAGAGDGDGAGAGAGAGSAGAVSKRV